MSPVNYIERTTEHFAKQGFPPYQWAVNQTVPWTPFVKRLEDCRVAMISSGGIYIRGKQPPFDPERDDLTFREIPRDIDVRDLSISHNHYDHSDADKDVNVVFPIERIREMEQERFIGSVAPVNYAFMGRIFKRRQLEKEMAPEIARKLKENKVDVFLLVPA